MFVFTERQLIKAIKRLLFNAGKIGIDTDAKLVVEEYIASLEYGLAFDHLLYELYERKINITPEFFYEITEIANLMKLREDEYVHMKELVKGDNIAD